MIRVDWKTCESMSDLPELEKLESWCQDLYESLQRDLNILEIGSYKGKTTALMAQFGTVLAVDLWGNVDDGIGCYVDIGQHHFVPFIQSMIRLKLIERVHPIVSTSKVLETLPNLNLDFAFIDASHQYEEVKKDIFRTEPHMSDKGLISLHDYCRPGWGFPPYDPDHPHHGPHDPWAGVHRAVDEFCETSQWKIKEHFLGIVLLERE